MPKRKAKDLDRSPDLPHNWIERHLARMAEYLYDDPIDLSEWAYRRTRLVGPNQYEEVDDQWGKIQLGEEWGGEDMTGLFRTTLTIPASHAGPDAALDISLDGGEAQLSIDGQPWQGLDWFRQIIPLGEVAQAGRTLTLELEAYVINYPYDERRHDERPTHCFERARLVKLDREIEAFLFDASFVFDAYRSCYNRDDSRPLEEFLLRHLEAACRALGPSIPSRAVAQSAARRARKILRDEVFASDAFRSDGLIGICAHSHLDIVYLWPIKETLRKNCRTITNMLSLMREYPDYRFSYSQPFLYERLKERYPTVYDEVRQRVREGRWEPIGAMYVEPDGNLPSGESFVRQLLFGKRFLQEEFGVDALTCWLPDVFGILYTLPQILRKAGVRYCLTAKLNVWNDTNDFPYDTFRWRGPDGSEVITHFPPTHFAQNFEFDNLLRHWRDFRQRQTVGENLFVYGWGDGGGGPTREMVEATQRAGDFPGLPATQVEFAETFFERQAEQRDALPVWDDELYLEAHRGTYTTKGQLKRFNRKAEILYRDAEILSSLAGLHGGARVQERLNAGWKLVLLNQFHDTLPGTHKPACVPDILADYDAVFAIGESVRDEAIEHICRHVTPDAGHGLILFNTLSWPRDALVECEPIQGARALQIDGGPPIPLQDYAGRTWLQATELPSLGWTTASVIAQTPESARQQTALYDGRVIETSFYRIEIAQADDQGTGTLSRIYDKANAREVLAGPGNEFQVFEDDPGFKFSAWDIAYHLEEYRYPVQQLDGWQLAANGPHFAVFTNSWRVLDSVIEQEMWLYAADPRIDFRTRVDWRDQRKLLKVAFPVEIRARRATYDLPFGNIERSTHRNTTWEQAKYEVCAHKWADLSEGNYGVALLNDCKYGYDVRENVLRLSLVRSPVRPDGQSDIGSHAFTYSLLPHAGDWRLAQVDRRAYELNVPVLSHPHADVGRANSPSLPGCWSLLTLDAPSLIVEALKQAEDSDGLILRTFDNHGNHVKSIMTFVDGLTRAAETDLLEKGPHCLDVVDGRTVDVFYTPYEIKTHRLNFEPANSQANQQGSQ